MIDENPWPRKGDVLFMPAEDWHNACVGFSANEWHGFAESYKRGADRLVDHVIETQSEHDYLVYPIVFLYRQALEVSLKHLLLKGGQLLDSEESLPKHHRLFTVWQSCRAIVERVWPDGPAEELDAVEAVIQQFDAKDPSSTTFRYPVDTTGQPSLPVSELINLRNLAEVANRTYALLEALQCGIGQYLQDKWDMEREAFG